MALNQLPIVEATITVIHTGPTDGASFTTTLDASDGAPLAPQQVFTFDLNVFAPDMIGTVPQVDAYVDLTGERVEVSTKVEDELITVTFFEPVEPTEYRVKAVS